MFINNKYYQTQNATKAQWQRCKRIDMAIKTIGLALLSAVFLTALFDAVIR